MAKFSSVNQPANRGRKKAKWKSNVFDKELTLKAVNALERAIDEGESWAIMAVIDRTYPKIKSIAPRGSLEAQELEMKIEQNADVTELIETCERFISEQQSLKNKEV